MKVLFMIIIELVFCMFLVYAYFFEDIMLGFISLILTSWFMYSYIREDRELFVIKSKLIIMCFFEVPIIYYSYYSLMIKNVVIFLIGVIVIFATLNIFFNANDKKNLKEIKEFFVYLKNDNSKNSEL